jgi:hypothetical protein
MCDTDLAKLEKSLKTTRQLLQLEKNSLVGNEREDGTSALRRKRTCYHRRNGAGSFAMFTAIRRASRRRDGICADVIQSSARGWGVQ